MILSLKVAELKEYLIRQMENCFPDGRTRMEFSEAKFDSALQEALQRAEKCFSHIKIRNYNREGNPYFYHLHLDQYSTFLYFLSNSIWKMSANKNLCDKLILLNRNLSSCWFSYKGNLPDIFCLVHPVGSVVGHINVNYSDFLVILQNVTIEAPKDNELSFGKGVFLGAGAKVIRGGLAIAAQLQQEQLLESLMCQMIV